ncbi:PEPxxWA-CTERM sorting domain-containing protein [Sphingomonas sp. Tas61C01]|uniref:PEPxxWA-CTERM sorting domain-containing protein n=1 Tax=Sphingomonas sp. Tas61C01 TaxID=3458297 RepID=UPI00403EA01D
MKTRLLAAAAALLVSTSIVAPAQAAPITYTLTGSFTGVNGGPFTNVDAIFTGLGDTDDAGPFPGLSNATLVPLSSFSAVAGGLTYTFTTPISFFVNRDDNFAGFVDSPLTKGFVRFIGTSPTGFTSYDGVSTLAPTAATFYTDVNTGTFNTDRGDVFVSSATGLTLSATIAAVPEPATWAMMLVGFGMMGAAMRYRRRSTSTVYA